MCPIRCKVLNIGETGRTPGMRVTEQLASERCRILKSLLVKLSEGIEEWMMIEMQGTIENGGKPLSDEVLTTQLRRKTRTVVDHRNHVSVLQPCSTTYIMISSLCWRREDNEALLLVGHHLLEGKISELEKPFLVVRTTPGQDP
ncbi:unnamed protein product, partial [Strongylus vulgaris]